MSKELEKIKREIKETVAKSKPMPVADARRIQARWKSEQESFNNNKVIPNE